MIHTHFRRKEIRKRCAKSRQISSPTSEPHTYPTNSPNLSNTSRKCTTKSPYVPHTPRHHHSPLTAPRRMRHSSLNAIFKTHYILFTHLRHRMQCTSSPSTVLNASHCCTTFLVFHLTALRTAGTSRLPHLRIPPSLTFLQRHSTICYNLIRKQSISWALSARRLAPSVAS
jgi:hypothetical protein